MMKLLTPWLGVWGRKEKKILVRKKKEKKKKKVHFFPLDWKFKEKRKIISSFLD